MSATPLSRIVIELRAKGSCIPLLSLKEKNHVLIYAVEQLTVGRCRAMMLIHITKRNDCFGCIIEDDDLCNKRGLKAKLVINEKGGRT